MKHSGQAPIGEGGYIREKLEETLPCIWFPMQREERDENWFWRRLCNKAHEYSTEIYERISVVEIPKPEREISYVVRNLNKYLTRPVYLVLDDYQECNESAKSQAEALSQIEAGIEQISGVTQNTAASTQESSAISEQLAEKNL